MKDSVLALDTEVEGGRVSRGGREGEEGRVSKGGEGEGGRVSKGGEGEGGRVSKGGEGREGREYWTPGRLQKSK